MENYHCASRVNEEENFTFLLFELGEVTSPFWALVATSVKWLNKASLGEALLR